MAALLIPNESVRIVRQDYRATAPFDSVLAHPDPMRRTYARGSFWKERVEMAQWWADHLDTLRKGGEVVRM
jgi:hypothetical protein